MLRRRPPIGVILAGGQGRRIGGSKAVVQLAGQPLISYPLEAVRTALGEVAVVAKADTSCRACPGLRSGWSPMRRATRWWASCRRWHWPRGARSWSAPATCRSSRPSWSTASSRRISANRLPSVACCGSDVQPLLGCYAPRAIDPLRLGLRAEPPVRELVASLDPRMLEVGDPELLFNIDSPEDLLHAAGILDGRARAGRRPASRM